MAIWIYTLLTYVLKVALPAITLLGGKTGKWASTRSLWKKQAFSKEAADRLIWFHCASIGEFEQAVPVIERIKTDATIKVMVTFFSPSGYNAKRHYPKADLVTYLPIDTPGECRKFLDHFSPDITVFVKYELWFNMMNAIQRRKIPMTLISAHFPKNHWTLNWPGNILGRRLNQFEIIFTQDEFSTKNLHLNHIHSAQTIGDTRVDRVLQNRKTSFEHEQIEAFAKCGNILIIGSNWPEDDLLLIPLLKKHAQLRAIVAPHELGSAQMEKWINAFGSELIEIGRLEKSGYNAQRIIYVNRIGMLSKIYKYGSVAYIGGGFGKAVHNTLEAAVFEIPIIFGPNNKRFLEIQDLKRLGAGIEIHNLSTLEAAILKCIDNPDFRKTTSKQLVEYINAQKGASEVIANWIMEKIGLYQKG